MENVATQAAGPAVKGRRTHGVWRVVRVLLLAYLGVMLVFSMLQTMMIFPGAATQGQPDAVVRAGPGEEVVELRTADGEKVVALFGAALTRQGAPHPDAKHRPTVLFFYGNGMCLADCAAEFDAFRRLGANVMIPDYLGYGMSGGKPSEAGCYATADAAYAHLRSRADVDPGKIIAAGWSLGSASAIDLASREPVAAVAAFSPFTSMAEMARRVMPILPTGALLKHHFENERKLRDAIKCPVLIAHGRQDSIIPCAMGERLAAVAGDRLTSLLLVDAADHNDFFAVGGREVTAALGELVERVAGEASPGLVPRVTHDRSSSP